MDLAGWRGTDAVLLVSKLARTASSKQANHEKLSELGGTKVS